MRFLLLPGIGDSAWALFKLQDIAKQLGDGQIELFIATPRESNEVELRALNFLRRFKFVRNVDSYVMPEYPLCNGLLRRPGRSTDSEGRYRYMPDGPPEYPWVLPGIDFVAIPNSVLEHGVRLENWLPKFGTNWRIFDDFVMTDGELAVADEFRQKTGPFAVFYTGSLSANTNGWGHNRGPIWQPSEWLKLGRGLHERYGLKIVIVGAGYDASYYSELLAPELGEDDFWVDLVGSWPKVAGLFALLRRASLLVSYQSGIGIVSHYLGVPTAIFWRPEGNSVNAGEYVSFDERMSHAWAYPDWQASGRFLPCTYGRHGSQELLQEIEERGWLSDGARQSGSAMKMAVATLTIGDDATRIAALTHVSFKAYAARIGADFIVMNKRLTTEHVLWDKLQLHELLNEYDRIIYVDTDVLIRNDCPNLFELVPEDKLGMCNEGKYFPPEHYGEVRQFYGVSFAWDRSYYNTGVMVISRRHQPLFKLPKRRTNAHYKDQDWLNVLCHARRVEMFDLPLECNRMLASELPGAPLDSFIVHFTRYPFQKTIGPRCALIEQVSVDWQRRGLLA